MISVACVKWGTMYSAEYVNVLHDSVRRNLQAGFPGRFVCFTDDPSGLDDGIEVRPLPEGLSGWWNKLYLFSPEAFPKGERVFYFDLDTCITGPLDVIANYKGKFAILRDVYRPDGLQSSVMAWEAGNWTRLLWERWSDYKHLPWPGGDQQYIEAQIFGSAGLFEYDIWQDKFQGRFKSYKVDCRGGIPKGCSVVFFHGVPRPHEVKEGWVPHVWKVGGGSGLEFIVQANTSDEKLRENVLKAKKHKHWIKKESGHTGKALIVGGGPSLESQLYKIRGLQKAGAKIFACGNTGRYLAKHLIDSEAQVFLDARPENAFFVLPEGTRYVASQCDAATWLAAGPQAIGFHAAQTSYADLTRDAEVNVGGGTTVGMKAIALAYLLGYRNFHLFGFDSCYQEDRHHAYPQSLNDGERQVEVKLGDKTYLCAPWMVSQAEEFKELAPTLVGMGCSLVVHGDGLIQEIASYLEMPQTVVDIRASEILKRLNGAKNPIGAEVGVFAGALSIRLLSHPLLTLYMVDSWTSEHSEVYKASGDFHAQTSQSEQDRICESAQEVVSFAEERAKIVRADSLEAAKRIEDQSLDFVFLDADHTYEAVKADLEAWWPKVKPGGFISGHDYDNPDFPLWGVKQAVDERFPLRELGGNYTWFMRKHYEH